MRLLTTLLVVLSVLTGFCKEYEREFFSARSIQDQSKILDLINELESVNERTVLLAEAYLEYGMWGALDSQKRLYFEKALSLSRQIILQEPQNGKAYYVAAVSTARLIDYVNVFQKLALLSEFDRYMNKAIELLDDPLYMGLALMGFGIRYMTPPWPLNDLKKAQKLLEDAQRYLPNYSGVYLYLGTLFLKKGEKQKAKEMFNKVISMEPDEMFLKAHEENVEKAKEYINRVH